MLRYLHKTSLVAVLLIVGCATGPENPSFPLSSTDARIAIDQMRQTPHPLPRPLVIVGGFLDPNIGPPRTKRFFDDVSKSSTIITVSLGTCMSFDECRRTIIAAVDRVCPSNDESWTTEVDVIGQSMGGLAARYAAAPSHDAQSPRRLKIARLFTISSPHTGATLAQSVGFIDFHRDMRPGSQFLADVARADADARYELFTYVHLHDEIVGVQYAAAPGSAAWWLSNPPLISAHFAAMLDDRILADIARRLRGEQAFSQHPPSPLPNS